MNIVSKVIGRMTARLGWGVGADPEPLPPTQRWLNWLDTAKINPPYGFDGARCFAPRLPQPAAYVPNWVRQEVCRLITEAGDEALKKHGLR